MIDATTLLRAYTRKRLRTLERMDAPATQQRVLLDLIAQAANTRFGRDHDFAAIRSVEDFQRRVPLRRYEDFWREYWQSPFPRLEDVTWPGLISYFAVSSGTTSGVTKNIPCSREMVRSNRRAGFDIGVYHLANRADSRLLGGLNFMLGGSTQLVRLAPKVWSGDLSGIAGKTVPWWFRKRYFPPRNLETIADWEEKIERMAPASLQRDIRGMGGTPSWMLLFFEKLFKSKPNGSRLLKDYYPNLELIVHGGINFAPYRTIFKDLMGGSRAETREVYPASEGFIAMADRGDGEGLRLIIDNGLFFEFVPVEELDSPNPTRHWVQTAETGVNYAIVLTTCAGLWSYVIGDTVRLVDRNPVRLLITGRTAYSLSAFGEHLIAEEIETAVASAAASIDRAVSDYSVGALFPQGPAEVGGHLFIVEFTQALVDPTQVDAFATRLDATLAEANEDYQVHRNGDYGMGRPRIHVVPPGTFARWMKARGRLGGQNKVPRIINDPELFAHLRSFADGSV